MGAQRVERQRRPRPQLDRGTILDAAVRLAADSAEPLTVRRLGAELGADPTAIYRHFRDKDELVRAVLDRLIGTAVARVDPSQPWRARLEALSAASIEILCAHPSIGALASSQTTGGEGETAAIEATLAAMNEAGLEGHDAVRFYAVYSSYLISFVSAQAAARVGVGRPAPGEPAHWIEGSLALRTTRHPAISAVREELVELRDDEVYAAGISVILDAVEARVRAG